jgi:HPt (histidine-containing phosphotransfer) domain-containing protein
LKKLCPTKAREAPSDFLRREKQFANQSTRIIKFCRGQALNPKTAIGAAFAELDAHNSHNSLCRRNQGRRMSTCAVYQVAQADHTIFGDIPLRMPLPEPHDLDPEALENLRALGEDGDDTFLREIIGIYLADTPLRLADIRNAAAKGDSGLYTRSAHTIKGSSSNVGALAVRAIAEQLEKRSRTESHADLEPLLGDLETAFARAATALRGVAGF